MKYCMGDSDLIIFLLLLVSCWFIYWFWCRYSVLLFLILPLFSVSLSLSEKKNKKKKIVRTRWKKLIKKAHGLKRKTNHTNYSNKVNIECTVYKNKSNTTKEIAKRTLKQTFEIQSLWWTCGRYRVNFFLFREHKIIVAPRIREN